jgi:hypothetical protein
MRATKKKQRRNFQKLARDTAQLAAKSCRDYDDHGKLVRVGNPKALTALERGFSRMFEADCTPQVLQLSRAEGLAFPRQDASELPENAKAWLAVGLDSVGCATYVLRWLGVAFEDPLTERAVAEYLMFAELYRHVAFPGFPVGSEA